MPPVARDETQFDPGAKYHVAASMPYARYFLARVLQFQFYQAACKQAGWKGPLHRCSFYGNKEVGAKLNAMLTMGAVEAVAGRAAGVHRQPRNLGQGAGRLFRAAEDVARPAEQGQAERLVRRSGAANLGRARSSITSSWRRPSWAAAAQGEQSGGRDRADCADPGGDARS